MKTISMQEAKAHLSRFVDQAAAGEEIVIVRGGRPVARLVALAPIENEPRHLGLGQGLFQVPDDFDRLHQEAIEHLFGPGQNS